ncbi:hypothetical protein CBM2615_B70007 [Cupriavidus taiwanensis]|uniref:Uncharacterized protein n=1 Tax=Cupriavidus taiwanensis TaxID=164546 RepID=A0A375ECG3_9BURK|nr:hypothetical protein CBM2614_B60007 [Cupriavidus taiwanensis]SOZ70128.1 hypothetical protein CBM2615_B70007 [Cupriavidus taiwanensis]SOZ72995.1 hypothetical protein CBM2613_B50137 [Cupriavidus taiwanensis]SPA09897.1 hypothetical protein CBM2625_B60053 [Cupriavidus taiwanensis]
MKNANHLPIAQTPFSGQTINNIGGQRLHFAIVQQVPF